MKLHIYKYPYNYIVKEQRRKISHISFSIGKRWVSIDRSGVMGWTGTKNFYLLFKTF